MGHWEHYSHEADIGLRGFGETLAEAFEQAALAMTAVITDPASIVAEQKITIECQCEDSELLFTDWLNAIIYEMATRKMLFSQFKVSIDKDRLSAEIWGEQIDVARHQPIVEIKGATFTTLKIAQVSAGMWMVQTVVDV